MSDQVQVDPTDSSTTSVKKKSSLAKFVFLALFAGVIFGYFFPSYGVAMKPMGDMFIRMIKMIIVPLIFSTLIVGIAGAGTFKKMGSMGIKALIWFNLAVTVALAYGIILANFFEPGKGVPLMAVDVPKTAHKAISFIDMIVNIVPTNFVQAASEANLLQLVFFSCFFGIAVHALGDRGKIIVNFAEAVMDAMFNVTHYVMKLTPFGVFAFSAWTVGKYGLSSIIPLAKLVGTLYLGLVLFIVTVLFVACCIIKVNFFQVLRAIKEPIIIAFSTCSSEAALPLLMKKLEKFGVPKHIVGFVLPTGYAFNLDGGTLYVSMAVIFVAQLYGIQLDFSQEVMLFFTLTVAQKGVAAVPGAAFIVLSTVMPMFGIPLEGLFMVMGVDRLMDMGRTTTNLIGNAICTLVVARWEKELPDDVIQLAYTKNYEGDF